MNNYEQMKEHIRNGGKARRPHWVDPDSYVYFREIGTGLDGTPIGCFYAREPLKNPEGDVQRDVLYTGGLVDDDHIATDWELLEN